MELSEFFKLSLDQKIERFYELSKENQFKARLSERIVSKTIKSSELSLEKRKKVTEMRRKLLVEGSITQDRFEELENE